MPKPLVLKMLLFPKPTSVVVSAAAMSAVLAMGVGSTVALRLKMSTLISFPIALRVTRIDDDTPYTDDLGAAQRRLVQGFQRDDIDRERRILAMAGGQDDPRVDQDTSAEPGLGSV